MAKESLFNILNNLVDFKELKVLDLFAGTGNISFEFASRGCNAVTAVDINRQCTNFIYGIAQQLNFKNLFVIQSDFEKFMKQTTGKWDLIFADPPYNMEHIEDVVRLVFSNVLLNDEGFLILEHSKANDFSHHPNFFDHRQYGSVNFTFFQNPVG